MNVWLRQLELISSALILSIIPIIYFGFSISAFGAFGLSEDEGNYRVDTGAGLVFEVKKSSGDIISLNYHGIEFQEPAKGSQINSGLGTTKVKQPSMARITSR